MIRVRGVPYRHEDDAHDAGVQRVVDAFVEGRQAGLANVRAGANPHAMGTEAAKEWERGRAAVEAQARAEDLKRRARRSCEQCDCGGKGLCRDAA